jgi:REP element-mobilizing transposase RayT
VSPWEFHGLIQKQILHRINPPVGLGLFCRRVLFHYHFPNATLDEFVVMPNHVHGIIILKNTHVETPHVASLRDLLKPGLLSKIFQAYKAVVTHWTHQNGFIDFAWQPRFYDHIIRDEASLQRIY